MIADAFGTGPLLGQCTQLLAGNSRSLNVVSELFSPGVSHGATQCMPVAYAYARSGSDRSCEVYCFHMTRRILEVNGASVVLTGSFNPAIFQPQWFVRQNLLPAEECEKPEIKVISPQVCEFQTERFIIQVTTERFSALAKPDANPAPLRELVAGTFFTLEHTPLKALGLNRDMHFALSSEEEWHKVGDTLVPKDLWKRILQGNPGLRSLWIQSEVPGFPDAKQEYVAVVHPVPGYFLRSVFPVRSA
jgi:hypothetical protein